MFKLSAIDACQLVVTLCVMIDLLGLSLTIPILANYARDVQGPAPGCPPTGLANATEYDRMYQSDACQQAVASIKANTGLLSTAYSAAMLISTFWMPVFSDKYGPRLGIIVSIFGSLLGFLGQGLTCPTLESSPDSTCAGIPGGFAMLVIVRFLGGLFGGTATVASAFIVTMYPQQERAKQFAKMGAAAMSAFVFGPFVGGGLAQFGLRMPLYVASALSGLAMLAAFKYVKDPEKLVEARDKARGRPSSLDKLNKKKRASQVEETVSADFKPHTSPNVWIISLQTCFTTIAFNGLSSLMALVLLEERLGIVETTDSVEIQGRKVALWIMAMVPTLGGTQIPVVMLLFPYCVKKYGLLPTGMIGTPLIALGIFMIPFWPAPGFFFLGQVIIAIGNGLQTNISNTYLSKFAPKGMAARTLAYGAMADTIGNILGPQLTQVYLVNSTLPFVIAGLFGVLSCICCVVLHCMGNHSHASHGTHEKAAKDMAKAVADGGGDATPAADAAAVALTDSDGAVAAQKQADESAAQKAEDEAAVFTTPLDEKQPLSALMHPSHFRTMGLGPRGKGDPADADQNKYFSIAAQQLSDAYIDSLVDRNHGYALRSRNKAVRARGLEANKDWIDLNMRVLADPSDADNDLAFRTDVAKFLSETGHTDWAMTIPGIDLDGVLKTIQVPM